MRIDYNLAFKAFQDAWADYPSQANEGYVPDRGGFKAGWFAFYYWLKNRAKEESPLNTSPDDVGLGKLKQFILDLDARLFAKIEHGDTEHRIWLKAALTEFFKEEASRLAVTLSAEREIPISRERLDDLECTEKVYRMNRDWITTAKERIAELERELRDYKMGAAAEAQFGDEARAKLQTAVTALETLSKGNRSPGVLKIAREALAKIKETTK